MVGRGGAGRFPTPTDRLRLRPVPVENLDILYRIWTDPAVRLTLWDGEVISKERAEAALLEGGEDFAQHGFGLRVAEEGGCVIGFCGLRRLDDTSGVALLYGIAPAHWGRGLVTEVAFAVLRYGFEEAGLGRILGIADKENAASRRVLEKIGMTFEGETLYEGRVEARYSVTKEDFGRFLRRGRL